MSRMQDNRLERSIPHALTRLFREQNRYFARCVDALGVSVEQAHILGVLFERGPLTMTDLGREVSLSSGTLSAAVDRMEAIRLVRRRASTSDRRAVLVEPTWPAPKREALMTALFDAEEVFLAPLSRKEREMLRGLLDRLFEGVARSARSRAP